MSPLCPCQKDRIKWEPILLLRVCKVLKCMDHLVIQGSVWLLPVGGCKPCCSQTSFSKVWAEKSRKFVGQSSWAPFFGQELVHVLLPHHSCWQWLPGVVFLQPLGSKEEQESQRGKKTKFLLLWTMLLLMFDSRARDVVTFYIRQQLNQLVWQIHWFINMWAKLAADVLYYCTDQICASNVLPLCLVLVSCFWDLVILNRTAIWVSTLYSVELAFPKFNEHIICRKYYLPLCSKFVVISTVCIKQWSTCPWFFRTGCTEGIKYLILI